MPWIWPSAKPSGCSSCAVAASGDATKPGSGVGALAESCAMTVVPSGVPAPVSLRPNSEQRVVERERLRDRQRALRHARLAHPRVAGRR